MNKDSLKRLIDVANGKKKADLVLKNGSIVDVCSGKIFKADLAVAEGYIAGFGEYDGEVEVDIEGKYISPGLMDAHIHIESSYCTPEEFGRMVVPHGTTTVIADPHEIVNVCGIKGFHYMQEAAKNTCLSVEYMMPSCVPATKMEDAGCVISAEDMADDIVDIPGLGEFMDYNAVIENDDIALDKLVLAKNHGKIVDGHSPNLCGKALNAYACAGIDTDHECSTLEEMEDRLERGIYVQLRQGSACHNLGALIPGINEFNFRRCLLCSDDRQPKTIFEDGHLEYHLKTLVNAGISPVMAIAMATVNVSDCYGLKDRGMIVPGKRADLVIFEDLKDSTVKSNVVKAPRVFLNWFEKADKNATVFEAYSLVDSEDDPKLKNWVKENQNIFAKIWLGDVIPELELELYMTSIPNYDGKLPNVLVRTEEGKYVIKTSEDILPSDEFRLTEQEILKDWEYLFTNGFSELLD